LQQHARKKHDAAHKTAAWLKKKMRGLMKACYKQSAYRKLAMIV
jgi:hypothetical protein